MTVCVCVHGYIRVTLALLCEHPIQTRTSGVSLPIVIKMLKSLSTVFYEIIPHYTCACEHSWNVVNVIDYIGSVLGSGLLL